MIYSGLRAEFCDARRRPSPPQEITEAASDTAQLCSLSQDLPMKAGAKTLGEGAKWL
jgi:hypothetical protein